jgi:hypothetical protein
VREIFSVRFFAAVGAVAALLFLLSTFFAARVVIDDVTDDEADGADVELHRIDLVERIESASTSAIGLDAAGSSTGNVDLVIDPSRLVRIAPGTPGVVHCQPTVPGACAIVADLLGEAVVWFALVPMGASPTSVQLPAIDTLDDGVATLVNGWQVRHAPALDRRCTDAVGNDEEYDSYREFRDVVEDDFVSVFDIPTQRLTAVVCRARVPYAPVTGSTLPGATVPLATAPIPTPPPVTAPPTLPPGSTIVNEG